MIELKKVTPDNFAEARKLDVHPHQKEFVAPVIHSIAEAYVYDDDIFRLIYRGDEMVGYILIAPFERDERLHLSITRLMIDQRYQRQGLGRATIHAILEWATSFDPRPEVARISAVPENEAALNLYKNEGFVESGIEDGEIALYKPLTS